MPRIRYTLREDVGDPREWSLTWDIDDDVTLGSQCGFCGRTGLRLTYEVARAERSLRICPICVSRYPVTGRLDGYLLDMTGVRDQVHGLTARVKQRTCQDVIRKVQSVMTDPEFDEILVYFDRNLQLSPGRAARLFAALPMLGEPIDARIFEVSTRSKAHQDEYGSLDEGGRALVWHALSSVQRRRMTALGHAPSAATGRRAAGRRAAAQAEKFPDARMPALSEPAWVNRAVKIS